MVHVREEIRAKDRALEGNRHFVKQKWEEGPAGQTTCFFNCLIAGLLLVGTLPLMLFVALAIKCEGPGPVLDKRSRIGRGGRRFEILNFRIIEYDQTRRRSARKLTRVGELLRQTRIEGLPQLVNVLRGEMNISQMD